MRRLMPLWIVLAACAACGDTGDTTGDDAVARDVPGIDAPQGDGTSGPPDAADTGEADAADADEADAADIADAPDGDAADAEAGWPRIEDVSPEALVLPPAEPEPPVELPDGIDVRFAALNVYGFRMSTPEAVGAFLASLAPDVVALSEMPGDQVDAVAQAAGMAHTARGGGGKALLSATPLADAADVALVDGRSLLHATTVIGGATFSIYGTHISWDLAGTRQARQIVDAVLPADPVQRLVMLGDFNDEHLSSQNTILETVLADAFTTMGLYPGQKVTWPSTGFDETEGAQTIDLVFFRRAFPAIVRDADAPNLSPVLSDHKPVVATLRFPAEGQPAYASDPFAARRDPFRDFPDAAGLPPNLLGDPGAEDGGDGWQAAGGAQATGTRRNLAPRDGDAMFAGSTDLPDATVPWSSWSRSVDLSAHAATIDAGRGRLLASAWMASGTDVASDGGETSNILKTYDDGEVVVDLRAADGALLRRVASSRRDTLGWFPFAAAIDVPPGTRTAGWTWIAHNKLHSGESNDAAMDDAYLGFAVLDAPHAVLGGNRVPDPGAEGDGDAAAVADPGWLRIADMNPLGPWGIAVFPPNCRSGRACWFAHALADLEAPVSGTARLVADVDLSDLAAGIDAGTVAVRWGGWLRTFEARVHGAIVLEIRDGDGTAWATFSGDAVAAAEWTEVVGRTRLPAGARRLRLHVAAALDRDDDGVFADDLFLVPERVDAP
jgi:endonuclease/exonuclease/phosphatase family metal-dependent hydrolase